MPRESKKARTERAIEINERLRRAYPDAACALVHEDAYQLLVATILSAQCTDKRVNAVTPGFFEKYPDPPALKAATREEIGEAVRSTGFFNSKAKNLKGMAEAVVQYHGGTVPGTMVALNALPGVGRKTANVILGNVFGVPGIVVDTHMLRLSNLLAFVQSRDAVKVEYALMDLIPKEDWTIYSHRIIDHGRHICIARRPQCADCVLNDLCPSAQEPAGGPK